MIDTIGRAGMDVAHVQHGAGGNRANRRRLLQESMRELDPALTAKQAALNENVDPGRTGDNVARVNDGSGGFRPVAAIDEVLDYGDAREARVGRKIKDNSFTTTTIVAHLPKTICEQRQWTNAEDETRTYWAANDPAEARRYFDEVVGYLGEKVLVGGQAAIHGYDVNLDEFTPHIQILCDNFAVDPNTKSPDRDLRVVASQTWTSHREVKDEKGVQISGQRKMRTYQAGLRDHMLVAGFPVETDVDPVRHDRKLSKPDYVELEEGREAWAGAISSVNTELAEKVSETSQWCEGEKRWILQERARVEADRVVVDAKAAEGNHYVTHEVPRLRQKAVVEGYNEGSKTAQVEMDQLREQAQHTAAQAALDANTAALARRVAEARLKAVEQALAEVEPAPKVTAPTWAEVKPEALKNTPDLVRRYFAKQPKVAESYNRFAESEWSKHVVRSKNALGQYDGPSRERWESDTRSSLDKARNAGLAAETHVEGRRGLD
jgi:colicin import membrane protein